MQINCFHFCNWFLILKNRFCTQLYTFVIDNDDWHCYCYSETGFHKICNQKIHSNNLNASGTRDKQDKGEDEGEAEKPTHCQDCQPPTGLVSDCRRQYFATNCCDEKYQLKSKIIYIGWLMAFQFKFGKNVCTFAKQWRLFWQVTFWLDRVKFGWGRHFCRIQKAARYTT